MFSIPFPALTLFALLILMMMLIRSGKREYRGAMMFIAASAGLISLSMIRWEWHFSLLKPLQAILATLLPAVAWSCFSGLSHQSRARRLKLAVIPVYTAIIIQLCLPVLTDALLFLIYAGYGIALLRAATNGADFFVESRFREASITQKMTFFAGCFLCFSALTDAVISSMMNIAPQLIALFQGMTLPLLCIAIVRAVKSVPAGEPHAEETSSLTDDEVKNATLEPLCLHIENLVRAHAYYLDTDLTLNKLARKLDIPARHISRAVNATRQCNVSQWLNGFRIEKAQDMLRQPQLKITDIMLETGFISKSNFNREFMRITGKTPTAFRQATDDSAARC